jgi:hypothetical protein
MIESEEVQVRKDKSLYAHNEHHAEEKDAYFKR